MFHVQPEARLHIMSTKLRCVSIPACSTSCQLFAVLRAGLLGGRGVVIRPYRVHALVIKGLRMPAVFLQRHPSALATFLHKVLYDSFQQCAC